MSGECDVVYCDTIALCNNLFLWQSHQNTIKMKTEMKNCHIRALYSRIAFTKQGECRFYMGNYE